MFRYLLPVFLFVGSAQAEAPVSASYRDFSGGINTYSSPTSLAPNESPNLQNVVIDEPLGALSQRNGYQSCGSIPSGNTATNLYEFSKNDGTRYLIATDNITIWATVDCVNFSTVTTGWTSTALPRFATILDKLWIVNGSTYPYVWDGSTGHYLDGTGTYPTGPKAKYIAYWKSRVWLANTPTAPSSIYFSSLTDENGTAVDPAISTAAWSATNQIYVNRDDGSPLYGIKVYRDNLYAFKETGISRIVFESEFALNLLKNVTTIGSKFQESIVEMDDGLLRFVGRDGIYAFDGSVVKRLSTKWTPTFYTIKQPSRGEKYKLWDTATDWVTGTLTNTSTQYLDGSVSLDFDISSRVYDTFGDGNFTANPTWTFGQGTNNFGVYGSTLEYRNITNSDVTGYLYSSTNTLNWGNWQIDITARNLYNATTLGGPAFIQTKTMYYFVSSSSDPTTTSGYAASANCKASYDYCTFELLKISNGVESVLASKVKNNSVPAPLKGAVLACTDLKISISDTGVITSSDTTGDCVVSATDSAFIKGNSKYNILRAYNYFNGYGAPTVYSTNIYRDIYITGAFPPSGSFISPQYNASGLSGWRTFDTDTTLNGHSILYSIKVATSAYNLTNSVYSSITPGAIVSACSTCTWVQWKADFSTSDNGVTPLLNSGSVGWITGDDSKSVISGINYRSRYWMSASTTASNDYNDFMMVESKSPLGTWTRYDLPISAMTLWNNNLYGAISNTGKLARLDYGTTDDGVAISSYWESRDEVYENPIFYKTINTGVLDYSNDPANTGLVIGLSPDQGTTYENRTIDLSASALSRNTAKLNYSANTALGFRTKLSNNVLGLGFKIYGLHNIGTQLPFYGN